MGDVVTLVMPFQGGDKSDESGDDFYKMNSTGGSISSTPIAVENVDELVALPDHH